MKKALLVVLLLASTSVFAIDEDDNPTKPFSTSKNMTNQSIVIWRPVSNVQAECEKESRKRGFNGFGYGLQACSFWEKTAKGEDTCTIITVKNPNMHSLGHEMRHCFQGNWHN